MELGQFATEERGSRASVLFSLLTEFGGAGKAGRTDDDFAASANLLLLLPRADNRMKSQSCSTRSSSLSECSRHLYCFFNELCLLRTRGVFTHLLRLQFLSLFISC